MLGVKDAFIIELNSYYGTELPSRDLTAGKLRQALANAGRHSLELAELYSLENDKNSWISLAKELRDHSTHISNVPRAYHLGGENHQKVFLKNPTGGMQIKKHFVDMFAEWHILMKDLIERLRINALKANKID